VVESSRELKLEEREEKLRDEEELNRDEKIWGKGRIKRTG